MWKLDLAQRTWLQKKNPENGRHFETDGNLKKSEFHENR